jgi:serine/threonine-protein kinase
MSDFDSLSATLTGRYSIERELGAGGMATVYLAHDDRHDRPVALKVLRPELAAVIGADRFLAEIKTTANLQHPHILPLHDSGEAGGFLFYVMPYIEGETLRDHLDREKQLPVEDAVRIAGEVADALDYAHRQGVIHRDIKPENILLHDGRAVVADFGIALAASKGGATRMTETGMSLGTPQYMSPEQAMGEREITARSDVYALGAVLYEMLSGDPPFSGSTAQAIVARVVTESPRSLTVQRHTIPRHVEQAVLKSLEKLPADRFATAAEFSQALKDTHFTSATGVEMVDAQTAHPAPSGIRDWRLWAAVAGVLVAVLAWVGTRSEAPPPVARYNLAHTGDAQLGAGRGSRVALSRDGIWMAYVGLGDGPSRIWVRRQEQLQGAALPGTDNVDHVFFEPGGSRVGFITNGQVIKAVSLTGGPPITVTDGEVGLDGATWSDDGYIYYDGLTQGTTNGLRRIPAGGGAVGEIVSTVDTAAGETDHVWPEALPGSKGLLFTLARGGNATNSDIAVLDLATGQHRVLTRGVTARYVESGHLVYVSADGTLLAVPFDLDGLMVTGDPVSLAEGVAVKPFGAVDMAITGNGTLAYMTGTSTTDPGEIAWIDHSGTVTPADPGWVGDFATVSVSPEGARLAVGIYEGSGIHMWVKQLPGGPLTRLTFEGQMNYRASWTPDGREVMFISDREGDLNLLKKRADGSAPPETVLDLERPLQEGYHSADGHWLVYRLSPRDIYALSTDGDTVEVVATSFSERAPALSPDGRWVAYMSDESGRSEVYVRPFPNASQARWQISTTGGGVPLWAPDSRTLYYRTGSGQVYAVTIEPGTTFIAGEQRLLFAAPEMYLGDGTWDIAPDGERFVAIVSRGLGSDGSFVLVENLGTELRDRVK